MTKKELFTCDICHTDFNSKEKAIACEKSHKKCVIEDYRYRANEDIPDRILLNFDNRKRVWFVRGTNVMR